MDGISLLWLAERCIPSDCKQSQPAPLSYKCKRRQTFHLHPARDFCKKHTSCTFRGEYHQESTANTAFCLGHFAAAVRRGRRVKGWAASIWLFHISYAARKPQVPVHLPPLADTDQTGDFRGSSGPVLAETSTALMVKLSGGILCLNCCPMVSSPLHNNAPFVLHSDEPEQLTQHTQSETQTCTVRRLPLRLKHHH